jgi:hypothetical protein
MMNISFKGNQLRFLHQGPGRRQESGGTCLDDPGRREWKKTSGIILFHAELLRRPRERTPAAQAVRAIHVRCYAPKRAQDGGKPMYTLKGTLLYSMYA